MTSKKGVIEELKEHLDNEYCNYNVLKIIWIIFYEKSREKYYLIKVIIIGLLIERVADVNAVDKNGYSALMIPL